MNPKGWASTESALSDYRSQLLDVVFQHSPIGKALVFTDGRFMAVNPTLCRFLGYKAEELLGMTFQDITFPDDLAADLALLEELSTGQREHYRMIKRYVHQCGHLVWAQLDVAMVAEENGRPAFFIAQIQDVTERLRREQEFLQLHERLTLALDATEDGIWDWDLHQPQVTVSPQWMTLADWQDRDTRPTWRQWMCLMHPYDRRSVLQQMREHLCGERSRVDVTYRHRTQKGSWRWLSLVGRVTTFGPEGQPLRAAGMIRDVSERIREQEDLQMLLNHLPAVIGYWDRNLHCRFGNEAYFAWFGKDTAHLPGRHISEVLDPRTYARDRPLMEAALRGEPQDFEQRITTPDGQVRLLHVQYVPDQRDENIIGFFALGVDVTHLRATERALAQQQQLARVTLMSIGDSVVTTDPHGQVTFLNPVAQRLTGWMMDEAAGLPVETVMPLVHDGPDHTMLNPLRVALRDRQVQGMADGATLIARDGRRFSIEDSAAPILSDGGELLGGVMVFHDVTEKRALADRMSYLAQHDLLTGLPNRALLTDRLQHLLQLSTRSGQAFALAFLDLDGFKGVNDTHGHSTGDELLRMVAEHLRNQLRPSDTLCRVGGDEFLILLADADAMKAELIAQRLLAALRVPFQLKEIEVRITGSIGVAFSPQDGVTAEDLMRHADVAMYRAKAEGRNRVCLFDQQLEAEQLERHQLAQAVQHAVALEEFELAYQPKVNGETGAILGVEALLRWTVKGCPVPPAVFIPVAEESGHMPALGTWVLRAACQQARAWLNAGYPMRVAVNVSALQFKEDTFLGTVTDILHATELPADLLELEVTEGVLMHDPERVHAVLHVLQDLGVHVSLDDFGTGYSSLSYLHRLPLNTLKIDRSFVNGADSNMQRNALLRSIVSLGQSLQLEVIAEGVETIVERDHLLKCGCIQMQGYLFHRPMPAAQIDRLLRGT